MPLVFHKNYRKMGPFRQAHPGVEVQGDGFFDSVNEEQLQAIRLVAGRVQSGGRRSRRDRC